MGRKIDVKKLKKCIAKFGLADTNKATGLSVHTLVRMQTPSYTNEPNPSTRMLLCSFFNLSEDELFPLEGNEAS